MAFATQFDDILFSRSRGFARSCIGGLLILVFLLDLAAACLLRAAPTFVRDNNTELIHRSWLPKDWVDDLKQFHTDTLDLVVLCFARFVVLAVLCWIGVVVGTPKLDDLKKQDELDPALDSVAPTSTRRSVNGGPNAPLLINAGPTGSDAAGAASASHGTPSATEGLRQRRGPGHGVTRNAAGLTLTHEVKEEHLASHKRKQAAEFKKNVVCSIVFAAASATQIYVGIKCIGFDCDWRHRPNLKLVQAILYLSSLAFVNLESFLAKRLVMVWTKEEGFFVPEFHPHRLFFNPMRFGSRCDMCRNRIHQAYMCKLCDWDCCAACFNKKDKSTGEGIVRGDKGVKDTRNITFGQYVVKGVRLIFPELPLFVVALALLAANSLVKLFMPNYQGALMDDVVHAHTACVHNITVQDGDCAKFRADFITDLLYYLGLSFGTAVLSALRQLCFMIVARRVILHIRGRAFESIIMQDIAFFDGMRTGDLQQRMSSDVRAMSSPLFSALPILLSNVILLVGGIVMCFVVSWRLSMLAFTTVMPIMHITRAYAEWSGKINREIFQDFSDGNAIANEAVSNIRTVRAASSEEFEKTRYRETLKKAFGKGIKDATIGSFATFLNGTLDLGAGVLILGYGGTIASQGVDGDGTITVGALIKYQLYYNMMNNSIQALSNILNSFTRAAGAAERVLSVIDLKPDIDPHGGAPVDVAVRTWDLEFHDVHFWYQMRPTSKVLDGLSFKVPEGNVCALVGASGGGKSTVVHLVLRYYDPLDGRITLGDVDYKQLNFVSMHKHIGTVSQETQLFNDTIAKNITYGAPDDISDEDVETVARAAQAWDFISSFEDGLHTKVGERGQRLSGGQKQRIAIARCLLRKPKLLLLDEATSALDAASEAAVQKALDNLIWTGNQTVLLVAHRLSTVVNANQIVVLQKGSCVEQGKHAELLDKSGVYAELVQTQLQHAVEAGMAGGAAPAAASSTEPRTG